MAPLLSGWCPDRQNRRSRVRGKRSPEKRHLAEPWDVEGEILGNLGFLLDDLKEEAELVKEEKKGIPRRGIR